MYVVTRKRRSEGNKNQGKLEFVRVVRGNQNEWELGFRGNWSQRRVIRGSGSWELGRMIQVKVVVVRGSRNEQVESQLGIRKMGVNQGGSYTEKWETGRMEDEVGVMKGSQEQQKIWDREGNARECEELGESRCCGRQRGWESSGELARNGGFILHHHDLCYLEFFV